MSQITRQSLAPVGAKQLRHRLLKYWLVGSLVVIVQLYLGDKGMLSPDKSQILLLPALATAGILGIGAHDIEIIFVLLVVGGFVYGVVLFLGSLVVRRVTRSKWSHSRVGLK